MWITELLKFLNRKKNVIKVSVFLELCHTECKGCFEVHKPNDVMLFYAYCIVYFFVF